MLNPFGNKAKLLREVERLCIFNDKGWGGDSTTPESMELERDKRLLKIQELISKLGKSSLPQHFVDGVENGSIREELEGKFYESLRTHFKGTRNTVS